MRKSLFLFLFVTLISIILISISYANDQAALQKRLSYVNDIAEVAWVE
jgi:hypothetical protein